MKMSFVNPVRFLALSVAVLVSAIVAAAEQPKGDFWLLRAENEIADPLVDAVVNKNVAPDELAGRITSLIDGRKLRQLARFTEQLDSEKKVERKKTEGVLNSPDGSDQVDLGVEFECESSFSEGNADARCRLSLSITEKESPEHYSQKILLGSKTFVGDGWELLEVWNNGKESTVYLGRISPLPGVAKERVSQLQLRTELLETKCDDLAQFRKSTPATRQKAIDWLRGRSKLLAAATSSGRSGEKMVHQDKLLGFYDKKVGYLGTAGWVLTPEAYISGDGRKADLNLTATWQNPKKPADDAKPEYRFEIGETFETGQTLLFEPTAQLSTSGQSLVCLITVTTQVTGERRDVVAERDPGTVPDKTSAYTYPVSPKFLRILQGAPDANQRPRLQQSLEQRGLKFEAGMAVTFRPTDCAVLLSQNREGHLAFMKLLKDLDLLP